MNLNPRHFLRMAKWARNPPSEKRLILIAIVIAVCLVVFGLERLFGWPDWLSVDSTPKGRINR